MQCNVQCNVQCKVRSPQVKDLT